MSYNPMQNCITYKGYTLHLRHDSQTKRVNGCYVLTGYGSEFFGSLASAKRYITILTEVIK